MTEAAMTEVEMKLPRKLSEEPEAPKPRRPSHEKVIENLDRWANSPGLRRNRRMPNRRSRALGHALE